MSMWLGWGNITCIQNFRYSRDESHEMDSTIQFIIPWK